MGSRQEALIYIEKENIDEAEYMSRIFVDRETRNRAYINTLGAELVMNYLSSEGIDVSGIHNLHSISKIIEKYDIADILLPNIHIDVRVVFDSEKIFVPKAHFKNNITPDIYVVLKLDEAFEHVELLGFIEPKKINLKNRNADYYFIEKSQLYPSEKLRQYIKDHIGSTSRDISEEDLLYGRELSVAMADHNILPSDEKELLEMLLSSDALRESVLEFDNFETLAFNAAPNVALALVDSVASDVIVEAEEDSSLEIVEEDEIVEQEFSNEEDNLGVAPQLSDVGEDILDGAIEGVVDDAVISSGLSSAATIGAGAVAADILTNAAEKLAQDSIVIEESVMDVEAVSDEVKQVEVLDEVVKETVEDVSETAVGSEEFVLTEDVVEEPVIDDMVSTEDSFNVEEAAIDSDTEEFVVEAPVEDVVTDIVTEEIAEDSEVQVLADSEGSIQEEYVDEPTGLEPSIDLAPGTDLDMSEDLTITDTSLFDGGETVEQAEVDSFPVDENIETSKNESIDINKGLAETIGNALKHTMEKGAQAEAAATVTEGMAAGVEAVATDSAIKLAGIAVDSIDEVIVHMTDKQNEHIDKINYYGSGVSGDAIEMSDDMPDMSDEISALARTKAALNAENAETYGESFDIDDFDMVEVRALDNIEQETFDLSNMDTVENDDKFVEDTKDIVNMTSINVASPTTPPENIEEMGSEPEVSDIALPDLDTYSIDDSNDMNLDDINLGGAAEENLMELNMNPLDMDFNDTNIDLGLNDDNLAQLDMSNTHNLDDNENLSLDMSVEEPLALDAPLSLDMDAPALEDESPEQEDVVVSEEPSMQISEEVELGEVLAETLPEESLVEESAIEEVSNKGLSQDVVQEEITAETASDEVSIDDFTDIEAFIGDEDSVEVEAAPQEWVEGANYDNLTDVERPKDFEGMEIVDSEVYTNKSVGVVENSVIISGTNMRVGEIPMDINGSQAVLNDAPEGLESIYENQPVNSASNNTMLRSQGRLGAPNNAGGSGKLFKILGSLVVFAIVGVIGFNATKMFKSTADETPQPITDDYSASNTTSTSDSALNVDPNNVIKMDNATNALANPTTMKDQQQNVSQSTTKKQGAKASYVEVSKLTWEVPDYISYNAQFKQYFQSVGKSLKLTLTSDLLLANDYPYSNEMRISITFAKDGTFKNAQIFKSSGSTQIDEIVLRTVNQTFKALKAPGSLNNDDNTTAVLKIYF